MRGVVLGIAGFALSMTAAQAVELIAPQELEKGWFDGRKISTVSPRGARSDFVFAAGGKVTRTGGRAGTATEGAWRLDDDGFCMKLGQSRRESCYLALKAPDGSLKVLRRAGQPFVWSR